MQMSELLRKYSFKFLKSEFGLDINDINASPIGLGF